MLNALENYRSVLQHLWPYDQSGNIIGKLLLKYRHISVAQDQKTKVAVVTSYFNNVQRVNAKRAANKAVILSFEEHERILKDTLISFGLRSEVPFDQGGREVRTETGRGPPGQQGQRVNQGRQPRRELPTTAGGLKVCYDYNNGVCNRKKAGSGCMGTKGESFAHICSRFDTEKKLYCHGKHPRTEHKQ